MTTTGKARVLWAAVSVSVLAGGLALAAASAATAQPVKDAADCAASFRFADEPVPVVKSADGQTVLASVEWGYSADHNLCYLALDDQAIAILRDNGDKIVGTTPPQNAAAAARCHRAYNPQRGFAAEPVPVVKTADGQTVLATVRWGYSADHNLCYLVLDDQAVTVLRTATAPPLAPDDREVLVQRAVGNEGVEVAAGKVSVSVPADAVEGALVEIREALGEFGSGIGGEVVGVEHRGPVRAPITVKWDVGHLSEAQQDSLMLVRWDEQSANWVLDDADYEIQDGVLTARTQLWTERSWVSIAICSPYSFVLLCPVVVPSLLDSVDLSDLSQSFQELLGRRVDAPKCSGGTLPEWVRVANEPFGGDDSSPIRLCYERGSDESVRVKMTNNRVYTQIVRITRGSSLGNSEPMRFGPVQMDGHDLSSLPGWIQLGGHLLFTDRDEGVVLIPPKITVQLDIPPSRQTVWFRSDVNWDTLLVDILMYAADIGSGFAPQATESALEVGRQVVAIWYRCAFNKLLALPMTGDAARDIPEAATALASCTAEALNPLTIANQLIAQEVEKLFDAIARRLTARAKLYLKIIEAVGYAADHILREIASDPGWSIDVNPGSYRPSIDPTPSENSIIAAGDYHTCALRSDQTIDCWGWNLNGRTDSPEGRFTSVSTNFFTLGQHSCAIREDNRTIDCWGNNDSGQLNRPIVVNRVDRYTAVAVGGLHMCAIREDRSMACWGNNHWGQAEPPSDQFTREFVAVAAGTLYTCAITTHYNIACWGENRHGQADPASGWFTAIAAGNSHSCAIRDDRTITCWGNNGSSQTDAPAGQYTSVSAGHQHTCAIRTDGTIDCWGDNRNGKTDAPAGAFTAVSAGLEHSCATKADHTIICWGDNTDGQSTPEADDGIAVPEANDGLEEPDTTGSTFTALSLGYGHTCGIRTDGTVACWGDNRDSRYRYQDDSRNALAGVPDGQFTSLSSGDLHACGIRTDGTVACWGDNGYRETDVPDGQFTAISAGGVNTCGIRTNGTVSCWSGANYRWGEKYVPDGQFTDISVSGLHACGIRTNGTVACSDTSGYQWANHVPDGDFTALSSSGDQTCGIKTDGTIACWGRGNRDSRIELIDPPEGKYTALSVGVDHVCGIESDGTVACSYASSSNKPWLKFYSPVPEGQFTALSSGNTHACGIRADGTVACWGDSSDGQTNVPDGQFTSISTGAQHACAIRINGTVACWGRNSYGQTDVP